MDAEVARQTADAAAKEASLNELKTKTKAFADAMTAEKKQLEASLATAKAELADIKVKATAFADNVHAQIVAEKDHVHALESQVQAKEAKLVTLKAQPASPSLDQGASEAVVVAKEREMQQRLDEAMATMRAQAFEKAQLEQDARSAQAQAHMRELEQLQATSLAQVDGLTAQLATASAHAQSLQANASAAESASASRATALQETLQTVEGLLEQLAPMAQAHAGVSMRCDDNAAEHLEGRVQRLEAEKATLEKDEAAIETVLRDDSIARDGLVGADTALDVDNLSMPIVSSNVGVEAVEAAIATDARSTPLFHAILRVAAEANLLPDLPRRSQGELMAVGDVVLPDVGI
ncbi:hypothetical protein SPRG_01222 [Saprolegnia parasitica CBS 223.65]|uniref:Uncharacterized protein n=1 Tax=Saprolegnia parasitica (strain CBS 223.65) TaxID=695850 RepID=A0A067CTA7_SAPPC|nr:hypothetical protein SPRG_01222 [Saprolegnia parasitica CBS 223.65]KDO33944.1 hypothetical protein SPRG_01222 [Saprolegnia parasitica CBS 223.65]|eukprot:XP_012194837.1 hypothetical protein SPRG_01222 [Saprolegnia parasitica CBS 223.65]